MADSSDDELEVLSPNTIDQAYESVNKRLREDDAVEIAAPTPAPIPIPVAEEASKKDDEDACIFVTGHEQGLFGNPCDTSAYGVVTKKSFIPDKNGSGVFDSAKVTWRSSYGNLNVVISITSDHIPPEQDSIDPFIRRLAVGLMGGCCDEEEDEEEADSDGCEKKNTKAPFEVFEWDEKEWLTKVLDPSTHKSRIHVEIIGENDE